MAPWWAAVPFAVSGVLLAHGLLTSRRIYALPDVTGILAWLAAGFLELHALVPWVCGARIVAAPLFFLLAWFMTARETLPASAIVAAWVLLFHAGPFLHALAGTAVDAVIFLSAGTLIGRWLPWPQGFLQMEHRRRVPAGTHGEAGENEEVDRDVPQSGQSGDDPFPTDRLDRLRAFADPAEGVRRVVEGIFPLSGADLVFFAQGNPPRIVVAHPSGPEATRGGDLPKSLLPHAAELLATRRTIRSDGNTGQPAFALVPVQTESGIAGMLGAFRRDDSGWDAPVVPMLEQGAFFIGRELELKARIDGVYWEVDRAAGIYHLVRRIAEAAERSRAAGGEDRSRRDELYRITAESVREHLDARRVLLIQVEEGGKKGKIAWISRENERVFEKSDRWDDLEDSYVEWVARKGEARLIDSGNALPVLPAVWCEREDGGAILLPVSLPDGFLGVMACFSRVGDAPPEKRDILRGEQFLNVMRMGISHTDEVERLSSEAQIDGLTGLLNRKTFCSRLDNVLARLDQRRACALIMLDIDHFKRINDGYGHPAGDEVIRTVAGVIARTVRKGDFAGRYGGEEFVLYLESVEGEKAVQAAERLRMLIRNIKYLFSGKEVIVTVSMGLACYPDHGTCADELVKRADEALYLSKAGGRDRVTMHEAAIRLGAI